MQAFLQYRNFRKRLEEQIARHHNKREGLHGNAQSISIEQNASAKSRTEDDEDVEKGEAPRIQQNDSSSRESIESIPDKLEEDDPREWGEEPIAPGPGGPVVAGTLARTISTKTAGSEWSLGTRLGKSMTGIDVRDHKTHDGEEEMTRQVFVVGYEGDNDPMNPKTWSVAKRAYYTWITSCIGAVVGVASSIDSSALKPAAEEFGVSEVAESLATGIFLIGFGVGALFAGPISETIGRTPVYASTLLLYMVFVMASGLAPNFGAQLAFRFLAGFFGSTPLTCAGGTVSDLWAGIQRIYAFPCFALGAFLGPIGGPIMGGWIVESPYLNWRWTEWITLITSGLVLALVVLTQPETFPPMLLKWKAHHLRAITGDNRYVAEMEIRREPFRRRLLRSLYRPFVMTAQEPIIILVALYLSVIYIILFTFLDGFEYIFTEIHGTGLGTTGTCFTAIIVGLVFACSTVPFIYRKAQRDMKKAREQGKEKLRPEFGLIYAMAGGSVAIPVSLIWIAWTSYPSVSIWSPIAALVPFGYGILMVFISCYLYIIDTYEIFAASGLASFTLIRYVASGGMVVVGIPFYSNVGVHWTCTILAIISAVMVPVPYIFWRYGEKIRGHSKFSAKDAF